MSAFSPIVLKKSSVATHEVADSVAVLGAAKRRYGPQADMDLEIAARQQRVIGPQIARETAT